MLHEWNVSPSEAVKIQSQLRTELLTIPFKGEPRLVAGTDISFNRYSPRVYAGYVVMEYPSMKVVERVGSIVNVSFPYVPGLLSFREIPPLLDAWEKLKHKPDLIVADGQGTAHPRRMGIACHLGILLDMPTIGCGKSRLVGSFEEPGLAAGSRSDLLHRGERIGVVLRTKDKVNPVFISPGHRMDVESAVRLILAMRGGYRIPEPTRQAHLYVNELRTGMAA
jgi:deoxyribonuclease V